MARRPVEIVLMKQLASHLAVPILIVDRKLDLLFFNESVEPILGRRFDETGAIRRGETGRSDRVPATGSVRRAPGRGRNLLERLVVKVTLWGTRGSLAFADAAGVKRFVTFLPAATWSRGASFELSP